MNIHLCGAYVTQIRKLDKNGNPTGPNLCREPMQITEDNCTNPDHGHPVKPAAPRVPPFVPGIPDVLEGRTDVHGNPYDGIPEEIANYRDTAAGDDDLEPIDEYAAPSGVPYIPDGYQTSGNILKEDTFEVNLGPVAPITHIDSAGADATKYPAPPKDRHSWAPDEARRRINDRRFNEPIPDAPDDEE